MGRATIFSCGYTDRLVMTLLALPPSLPQEGAMVDKPKPLVGRSSPKASEGWAKEGAASKGDALQAPRTNCTEVATGHRA